MKINNESDVKELDRRLKNDLGVDVRKYGNEEVLETFVDLLVFPEYVLKFTILPILLSIALYITGFFFIDLVHIEYVIYGMLGLILFPLTGAFLGVYILSRKLKTDVGSIAEYVFDITKSSLNDISMVNAQADSQHRSEVLGLLFKGIVHIVTIPMLGKIVRNKIPVVGFVVVRFFKKTLTLLSNQIEFNEPEMALDQDVLDAKSTSLLAYTNSIQSAKTGIQKVLNLVFGIAQVPLKFSFWAFLVLTVLLIYLVW